MTRPVQVGTFLPFGSSAGAGFDGLMQAAALTMLYRALVARQLADLDRLTSGRLVLGVGVQGEDRRECLTVSRQLLTGSAVTFQGGIAATKEPAHARVAGIAAVKRLLAWT